MTEIREEYKTDAMVTTVPPTEALDWAIDTASKRIEELLPALRFAENPLMPVLPAVKVDLREYMKLMRRRETLRRMKNAY